MAIADRSIAVGQRKGAVGKRSYEAAAEANDASTLWTAAVPGLAVCLEMIGQYTTPLDVRTPL